VEGGKVEIEKGRDEKVARKKCKRADHKEDREREGISSKS